MDSDKTEPPGATPAWWYRDRQRKVAIDPNAIVEFLATIDRTLTTGREFAVLVASDAAVREANKLFRGVKSSTDVLSFPDGEDGRLGDVLISAKRAAEQAREAGHSNEDEIKVLILHGVLHLLGWDHETDNGEMRAEERRLRRKLGLRSGLIERAEAC
jgi:probable rRNA maturation factor